MRTLLITIVAIAFSTCPAFSQVILELKHPDNSKSSVESVVKTNQVLTLAGMNIETKSQTSLIMNRTSGERAADGTISVVEKCEVLQSEISLPGGITLQFDSSNPDKKADLPLLEPIMERLRLTFKTPATIVLDPKGLIKEIKFPEDIAASADAANKSLFDTAKRKKAAEQARGYLPDGPVNPGDSWERFIDVDFGSGQTMAFRMKYTYAGPVEKEGQALEKINAKAISVNYSVDPSNSSFQVTKSDLKVTESNETILFDRMLGAVQEKTEKIRIEGPLTLIVNGMELDGKVDLTMEHSDKRRK